jgi:uncharacterized membrane protein
MGRGLIILLVASLGLNIFALGHFSGKMLAGPKPPNIEHIERSKHRGFDDPFQVMRYAEELSPGLRETFRAEIKKQLPALREHHKEMKSLRRELGALMSADEWDGDAVAVKINEISAAQDRQRDAFNQAFMNAFATLPGEQRKLLIDTANQRRAERRKERRERRSEDRPPPPEADGSPEEDGPPEE